MSDPSRTSPPIRAVLKQLPRAAWVLYAGSFINKFGSFVMPFLVLYLTGRGYTTAEAGLAISSYGVGHFLASALGGILADSIGRRHTIALSMFSAAITMMLLSQAESFGVIVLLTGALGLTSELYRPASSALLADLVPAEHRVMAFSIYRLAINAGFAFGPATAGFLAERSFFWLFLGDALTSALYGIVAICALPHGSRSHAAESALRPALQVMLRDRRLLGFLGASLAVTFIFFQMSATFPLHVVNSGFSSITFGALISLNGAIIVICELPLISMTRRLPARGMMAFGYLLVGLGFALNTVAHTLPTLLCVVLIWTLGEMISFPVSSAFLANIAPAHLRGRYMGAWGLTFAVGLMAAPSIGTMLYAKEPMLLWLCCGTLGILAALAVLMIPPDPQIEHSD